MGSYSFRFIIIYNYRNNMVELNVLFLIEFVNPGMVYIELNKQNTIITDDYFIFLFSGEKI